ncbi:MAG: hypothetical protein ACHQNV_09695 [Vicinamibacteria bacterium]
MNAIRARMALLLVAPLLPMAGVAEPAVRTFGDPSVRSAVESRTRAIYDAASNQESRRLFLMTRTNPLSVPDAMGTEATGVIVGPVVARMLASVWTKRGKYSVEYYRAEEGLLMVYETFAYFEEAARRDAWRNFMGLAAWERRTYFDARQAVGYAETQGMEGPAPGADGTRLREQVERLARLLQKPSP